MWAINSAQGRLKADGYMASSRDTVSQAAGCATVGLDTLLRWPLRASGVRYLVFREGNSRTILKHYFEK